MRINSCPLKFLAWAVLLSFAACKTVSDPGLPPETGSDPSVQAEPRPGVPPEPGIRPETPPKPEAGPGLPPEPEPQPDTGGPESGPEPPPAPDFAETRPPFIQDELTVTFSGEDAELDFRKSFIASEAQLYTALYEGLFTYHPFTMEPVPGAAEKWEVSEDKKTWTFTIRSDARYWNGDPLRAEDFRAGWLSLIDPRRESPYSSLFDVISGARDYRTGKEKNPAGVGIEVAGEKTLIVRLTTPASFFSAMLCHHSFGPVHPSMLEKEDWSQPVSNGPFYLLERQRDRLILAKNDEYWDASQVKLSRLIIRYPEDGDEASALWNSGEARWISGDVNLDILTDRSGIQVNAMFATHYYFIRSAKNPWGDYRLRRALSLALPWERMREGHFLPAKTLIYPIPGYPEVPGLETSDEEEAARLLREAGYPGGAGLPEL
ncbi:MAG: peptide ABC transporter substrate-binding protein, partial [Treponema sp.]|nr:peptide ABC transporter substrate-binding protein [Treponema sp.]